MGRILSFKVITIFSVTFAWSVFHNHQVINWTEAGAGFAAVMAGCVAFIAGKEVAIGKANVLNGAKNATE
jgi:hypothetical protein